MVPEKCSNAWGAYITKYQLYITKYIIKNACDSMDRAFACGIEGLGFDLY